MQIYEVTPVGTAAALAMNYEPKVSHDILVWMNRRGGKCTDDQVQTKLGGNRGAAMEVLSELMKEKKIQKIG